MTVAPERDTLSPEAFSRQVLAGTKVAETALLDNLTAAYAAALRSIAGDCARRFTVKATRLTAAMTAAWDESKHPRNEATGRDSKESPSDGGKFKSQKGGSTAEDEDEADRGKMPWKETLSRLDEFTQADVQAGKVPGIIEAELREGVAAHARDVDITLGKSAYLPNGRIDTVLVAHEAGHYVANEIQREAGRMDIDELVPFRSDPGYEVIKDLGNGRLRVKKDGAEMVIYAKAAEIENPWGINPDPGEILADTYSELLHSDGYEEDDDYSRPRKALLDRVAKTAKKMGLPYKRVYKVTDEGSERLTAAADPERKFLPPDPNELVPKAKLEAEIEKRTRAIREMIVSVTVANVLTTAGISFDIGGIFSDRILEQVGLRARDADASTRNAIRTVIDRAQSEGWTVPETAAAIKEHIVDLSDSTATQLARTDLIGTSNASADAAAHMVFEGRTDIVKRWTTADDDRVRPTHQDADGQTVPMSHPFNVGGSMLDYPGDPSGPDAEVCNCRCVVVYLEGEPVTAAAVWDALVAAWDPSKHPREPKGTRIGGRWAPKDAASQAEMETLWNLQKMDLHKAEEANPIWTEEGGLAAQAKRKVAADLAAELAGDPDWEKLSALVLESEESKMYGGTPDERAAATLIHSWAQTSGDSDARALALQEAARAEFGLEGVSPYTNTHLAEILAVGGPTSVAAKWADPSLQPGMRKFVRAQYDHTQEMLRSKGIDQIQMYRGMKFRDASIAARSEPTSPFESDGPHVTPITSNPMSSWTHDYRVADNFSLARDHYDRAIVAMTVPASRVLSTPFTGFGSLSENESVVLGGDDDAFVWVSKPGGISGPRYKEEFDNAWLRATFGYGGGGPEQVEMLLRQQREARRK